MKKITIVPLPKLSEIVKSFIPFKVNDEILSSIWVRDDEYYTWFNRSEISLRILAELCKLSLSKSRVNIWIPDYFCNTSLKPLREYGAQLTFYPVKEDYSPDFNWCNTEININRPDIFLIVHYFGQSNPGLKSTVDLCRKNKIWLVEDAAHVLKPVLGVGEDGDFVIYSPHKHLAIPNGALLISRNNGPNTLNKDKLLNKIIDQKTYNTFHYIKQDIIWILKRTLQILGFRRRYQADEFWPEITPLSSNISIYKMSCFAKRLLYFQIKRIDKIAQLRRANCELWHNNLIIQKPINITSFLSTPYLASFSGENFIVTKKIYEKCQILNIPIMTWPDLPPEVLEKKITYKLAIELRKTRVYLPIHQTITTNQIITLSK